MASKRGPSPADTEARRSRKAGDWLTFSPVILAAGMMIPRLTSAQFGLFDDGYTLMTVRRILWGEWTIWQIPWEIAAGRLRPAYWLLPILVNLLAGKTPFWFYFANLVLFCGTVAGLIWLVRLTGGSRLRAALTGLLFAVGGPAVESYFTLSKGEALQAACLVASLIAVVFWRRGRSRAGRLGWWFAVLVALLLGLASKETGLAILPISGSWVAIGLWRARGQKPKGGLEARAAYFVAALTAASVFLVAFVGLRGAGLAQGGYSSHYALDLASLGGVVVRWSGWLVRDFGYVLPLGMVVLAAWLTRRAGPLGRPLLDGLMWMGISVIVFLPWARYTVEYYMLPFAIGAAGFGATATELALRLIVGEARAWRGIAWAGLGLGGALWLLTLPTNWSNARVQLAVDSANADVMRYVASQAPGQGQILINIQDPNEYVVEFGVHLFEFYGRSDLIATQIQHSDPGLGAFGDSPILIALPEVHNTPKLSVRMGVIEDTQQGWNSSLMAKIQSRSEQVFQTERSFRLAEFDSPRLLCHFFPRSGYCSGSSPVFDTSEFTYGWRVYRLDQ